MNLNNITFKIAKGMLAIFIIKTVLFGLMIITQACQKDELPKNNSKQHANEFIKIIHETSDNLKQIPLDVKDNKNEHLLRTLSLSTTICLLEDDEYLSAGSPEVNTLGDALEFGDVALEDSGGNGYTVTEVCFTIPDEPTYNNLQPAVVEAKEYLYAQGMSEFEIQEMIREHNGEEIDLIPLVMTLASLDQQNNVAVKLPSFFGTAAYAQTWQEIGACALEAIGADILFSLDPTSKTDNRWKKKAIKKAFGTLAKRMLGPIGVGIAVISFAICISK